MLGPDEECPPPRAPLMARFAVFGASGFIGRHLVASLTHRGHEVRPIYRDTRLRRA